MYLSVCISVFAVCVRVCLHSLDILNRFHDVHLTRKVFGLPVYATHMTSPST